MFYIKLIFNIVLVINRFIRLLISSFLNAVSEWLILYWKNSQKSHVLDNLHLRHDLDEINDAENDEAEEAPPDDDVPGDEEDVGMDDTPADEDAMMDDMD